MPLQSLSRPSPHTSAGTVPQVPQALRTPSSVRPSQSLSLPSQVSAVGLTPPWQAPQLPPLQVCVPTRHSPRFELHGRTAPSVHGQPAPSIMPSQSLSLPSHFAAAGRTWPTHGPHLYVPLAWRTQSCLPAAHWPTPAV